MYNRDNFWNDIADIGNSSVDIKAQKDLSELMGVSERSLRRIITDSGTDWLGVKKILDSSDKEERPISSGVHVSPDRARDKLDGKRFVFTCAQNNTIVHESFFKSLLKFCDDKDAQLVVGRFSYNKNGFMKTKDSEDLWYDPKIKPFVIDHNMDIGDKFVWAGELDINPTAATPLNGLHSYTGQLGCIVPHVKVQMQSAPRLKDTEPKFLHTTGALTIRNYVERRTGQIASRHHVVGALFVEMDDSGNTFTRQLISDGSGSFQDLDTVYSASGTEKCSVLAINWGDLHSEKPDEVVSDASWGRNGTSMLDVLKPQYQFCHDISDFMSRNHHNRENPYFLAKMLANKTTSVRDGLKRASETVKDMSRDYSEVVVVHSNHDAAFNKWLLEADIRTDPSNAKLWHEYNYLTYDAIESGKEFDPFTDFMSKETEGLNVRYLKPDESMSLADIEFGMHGHMGVNGSRGGPMQFRRLNTKTNTGHTHTPSITDGVYVSGLAASMEQGYNAGPTTWAQSHIVTYTNGKRALYTVSNGKWRA
jgi:hypothetical protein